MSEPQATTVVGAVTGTAGVTYPLWSWFEASNQVLVSVLGLIVLSLTALKLLAEYRLARKRLRDAEKGGGS